MSHYSLIKSLHWLKQDQLRSIKFLFNKLHLFAIKRYLQRCSIARRLLVLVLQKQQWFRAAGFNLTLKLGADAKLFMEPNVED